ncbi:L-ascorbate metabolism protein UlaG, beta-lactamase superfamily [Cyclonatronum proteinivorum]|uniref:UPF0173 metal-dependent hydrolase CYPRO_2971 n=1 Tax=Cyclonatronum proteinivorum TaxID=1457365 RepID=A0A345UP06_9BACT|nr:metal-dependent hydrolase [Cyclonatronum proteinivorum]AXJ02208.1 L-ascorbate metabolism protein UlaG, beta-lactamase superfamily [Cyclonatronum proteinivorum]
MSSALNITFLGHSAFKITTPEGCVILIDPFLSQNPSTPEDLKKQNKADYILLTHGHEDHVGDTLEIAAQTGATVVSTVELSGLLKSDGLEASQAAEFNKGGTLKFSEFSVTLTNANHSSSFGGRYAGEAGGLVLRFTDGSCIYHAGDTNIMPDFSLYADLYAPDIVMLPIGDHYTMGPVEAAMAAAMIKTKKVIPMHYGTFPVLTGSPETFKTEVDKRTGGASEVVILQPGESV